MRMITMEPSPSTITITGITHQKATPPFVGTSRTHGGSHSAWILNLLLKLRSRAWSGILGCAICAPRTVSPSLVGICLWNSTTKSTRFESTFASHWQTCGVRSMKKKPLVQRSFPRWGVSVLCLTRNGLASLRARLVPNEFRTVGDERRQISHCCWHVPRQRQ